MVYRDTKSSLLAVLGHISLPALPIGTLGGVASEAT